MFIQVQTEEELLKLAGELFHTLVNLRHWQKDHDLYQDDRGRLAKSRWEKSADELLGKYSVDKTRLSKEIKISVDHKTT